MYCWCMWIVEIERLESGGALELEKHFDIKPVLELRLPFGRVMAACFVRGKEITSCVYWRTFMSRDGPEGLSCYFSFVN